MNDSLRKGYLGIDVGSVSTNLVILDEHAGVLAAIYRRTQGQPIRAVQKGLAELVAELPCPVEVVAAGATGSARHLTGVITGADVVKNEITAHAVAASQVVPDVSTVLEIGGQDSKLIILDNGIVTDFAMNSVCAAGTGSFLDHQSARLGIPIEEFGDYAISSEVPAHIAGRCSVFAESDMIHKQQVGIAVEDIIYGLCHALVRNYINNLSKGKSFNPPIVFQGGVAANAGMKRAFEDALETEVVVPAHHNVMGAIGSAILAMELELEPGKTGFKGFEITDLDYRTSSFACNGCSNTCEVVRIKVDGKTLARWGGRCGKWEMRDGKLDRKREKVNR
ncbi:R-phenyllactate dehydratase activator [bacterium BMS3Abin01]|nr:R-phenyllactate dehydratase activator [bacterium BMS3Abin01]HDZ59958.1 2-hydroxyglutaryl-CoA dehydratase [Actinomycetota bacterium]